MLKKREEESISKKTNRKKVIGITGEKGKGKTTFVHVLSYLLSINGHAATIINFADYIKQVARECFGRDIGAIHGRLHKEDRELLCKIGDALRSIDPACLVKVVERKIAKTSGFIVIGDVRLEREAQVIRKYGGVIVRIESKIFNRDENYLKEHLTEREIAQIKCDFQILNEGTFADLLTEAKKVLGHFLPNKRWKS